MLAERVGRYPDVGLREARERALRNHLRAYDGIDPIAYRRQLHRRVPTFAEAAEKAISARAPEWSGPKQEQAWRRSLERHVFPRLGHLLVSDVNTQDVAAVLESLRERHRKSVVRVRQQISAVLAWALGSGYRTDNPCGPALAAVMPFTPPESDYHKALPYHEVPDALALVRIADRWIGERLLMEFIVLTAVRTNEARGAVWWEIDWAARKWTIPAERMKERKQHEVPLSNAALGVLREARHHPDLEDVRQRSSSDLIFPTQNGRELYNNGLPKMLTELGISCVPHGFRSSFSTWSAESGHDLALGELCLAHAVGSQVARRYRRTGLFVPRIPIMEEWGRYVASPRAVVPPDSAPSLAPAPAADPALAPRVAHFAANLRGRDFVVGDVHGCFRTLERALAELHFDPDCDRLFGVGDLVNRGPHSIEALEWLEGRFHAVALGNHERALLPWLEAPPGTPPFAGSEWSSGIAPSERPRWLAVLVSMPLAITIETPYGDVGIVHAEVPHRTWSEATAMIERGDDVAVDVALLGLAAPAETIRARQSLPVSGVRALVHGHASRKGVGRSANRWNIDTGAGISRLNRLTLLHVNGRTIRPSRFPVDESS